MGRHTNPSPVKPGEGGSVKKCPICKSTGYVKVGNNRRFCTDCTDGYVKF